jgi:hypothetical protein
MIMIKIRVVFALLCTVSIRAEILVVKHIDGHFVPLDDTDAVHSDAISDVLLKYQWPMALTNETLTATEATELFSQKPFAEEEFITRKLQAIDNSYRAIFVPTVLFELFCIKELYASIEANIKAKDKQSPLYKAGLLLAGAVQFAYNEPFLDQAWLGVLNATDTSSAARKKAVDTINGFYKKFNAIFYRTSSSS